MKENEAKDFLEFLNIIKSISRYCDTIVYKASRDMDLSPLQARIILTVYFESDDIMISDISKRLAFASSNLSSMVNTLIEKGLLSKKRSNKDQRTVYVSLTDQGYKACEELIENMNGFENKDNEKYLNQLYEIEEEAFNKDYFY